MSVDIEKLTSALNVQHPLMLLTLLPSGFLDCLAPKNILNAPKDSACLALTPYHTIYKNEQGFNIWLLSDRQGTQISTTCRSDSPLDDSLHEAFQSQSTLYLHGNIQHQNGYLQLKRVKLITNSMRERIVPYFKGVRQLIRSDNLTQYLADLAYHVQKKPVLQREFVQLLEDRFGPYLHDEFSAQRIMNNLISAQSQHALEETYKELKRLNTAHYVDEQLGRESFFQSRMLIASTVTQDVFSLFKKAGIVLTTCQVNALHEITLKFTRSKTLSSGLLAGDVGTGKSMVIAGVLLAVARSGGVAICMTLDEVLATELIELIKRIDQGARVKIVTSAQKPTMAYNVGEPLILVGTTALLRYTETLRIKPDLLVIDEEHKFGSSQKNAMATATTYSLYCTATCIPKTKQLAMLHSMDIYTLYERPVERSVKTRFFSSTDGQALQASVEQTLSKNKQTLIVLPAVKEIKGSYLQAVSVERVYDIWNAAFPGKVIAYHGQLTSLEKAGAMQAIKENQYQIIIASTATEVGLNIPNLTHCVCVEPQRFGLSQLHQIRGRTGRYGEPSFFDMFAVSNIAEQAMKRVNLLLNIDDGQALAEEELRLRGFGSLRHGENEQSGHPTHLIPRHEINSDDLESLFLTDKGERYAI